VQSILVSILFFSLDQSTLRLDINGLDMMTKPLPREKFEFCKREVGLVEPHKLKFTS
jgi:hypothetical protein